MKRFLKMYKQKITQDDMLKMIGMFHDIVSHIQAKTKIDSFVVVGSGLYSKIIDSLNFYTEKIKPFYDEKPIDLLSDEEIVKLAKHPKYAVYHKPTKLWIYFREVKDKFGILGQSIICLCLKTDATVSIDKDYLKQLIEMGEFNSDPFYGKKNFSEFQIKKL